MCKLRVIIGKRKIVGRLSLERVNLEDGEIYLG